MKSESSWTGWYFGWDGEEITRDEWIRLYEQERHIGKDTVNGYYVSTVWLGTNHQWGDGPPLIFETMIFRNGDMGDDVYCVRYATKEEALEGHKMAVLLAQSYDPGADPYDIELEQRVREDGDGQAS